MPLSPGNQCHGNDWQDIITSFPADHAVRCLGTRSAPSEGLLQECGGGSSVPSISSLGTLKVSVVDGDCSSSSPSSLVEELVSTRLDTPLCGAGVDSAADAGMMFEWPNVGRIALVLLCPEDLSVGEQPVHALLLFIRHRRGRAVPFF